MDVDCEGVPLQHGLPDGESQLRLRHAGSHRVLPRRGVDDEMGRGDTDCFRLLPHCEVNEVNS